MLSRCALLLLAGTRALLATPAALSAQQSIRGVVAQVETGDRIARAAVLLLGIDGPVHGAALSDTAGEFEIAVPSPGKYLLRALRAGYYPTESGAITVPANAVVEVRVNLRPDPVLLEAVTVYGEAPQTRELREFHLRRSQRRGYSFTRADFERLNASRVMDLLPEVPGFSSRGTPRTRQITLNFRRCQPAVFIDGYSPRLAPPELIHLLETLPLHMVYGVEVFRDFSSVPPEYGLQVCGAILIWTVAVER